MWDSHRVIPRLLATCCSWQPEELQHVGRQTSGYIEVLGDLILRHRITRRWTENAIGWTVVIALLSELRLDGLDRGIRHRDTVIVISGLGVIVIVLRNVSSVVVIWVIIVAVVRIVIPREKPGI